MLPSWGTAVLCFVMVETREGVEKIDEIASTPGLGRDYVGPADLALGLGIGSPISKEEPNTWGRFAQILAACKKYASCRESVGNGKAARRQADRGFRFVTFNQGLVATSHCGGKGGCRARVETGTRMPPERFYT